MLYIVEYIEYITYLIETVLLDCYENNRFQHVPLTTF